MSDLIYLLDQLVDLKGNIIIPKINEDVAPLTDDERATYTDIDFDKVSNKEFDSQMKLVRTRVNKRGMKNPFQLLPAYFKLINVVTQLV